MRNNKKGFTLVELIIVIAVIAILAAVLIPTFSTMIKKAKQSADTQTLKNVNTAVAVDKALDPSYGLKDAVASAYEAGFTLVPQDEDHCFVFNKAKKEFEYCEKNAIAELDEEKYEKIKFVGEASQVAAAASQGGIVYLTKSITLEDKYFDVKKDLVVIGDGKTTITSNNTSTTQTTSFAGKKDPIFIMNTAGTSLGLYGLNLIGGTEGTAGIVATLVDNVKIDIADCVLSNSIYALNIRNSMGPTTNWATDKDEDAWHGEGVEITVRNTTIQGGTALNWKRMSGKAVFTDCTLVCTWESAPGDNFTAICDEGYDNKIIFNNCTLKASGENTHVSVQWGAKKSIVELNNCTFEGNARSVEIAGGTGNSAALSGNKIAVDGEVILEGN